VPAVLAAAVAAAVLAALPDGRRPAPVRADAVCVDTSPVSVASQEVLPATPRCTPTI
jgi:hypothetical protein